MLICYYNSIELRPITMFDSIIFSSAIAVGFSGARSPNEDIAEAVLTVGRFLPKSAVFTGDCRGVDAIVRSAVPYARVFRVSNYGNTAHRSIAMIDELLSFNRQKYGSAVLAVFPARSCPSGLVPSSSSGRCFCGKGSGSWASAAYAIGSGLNTVIYLGSNGKLPPGWENENSYISDGWFVWRPSGFQLSLLF